MPSYDNYSPQIPNTDDIQDVNSSEMTENTVEKSNYPRRRRRSVNHKEESSKQTKSKVDSEKSRTAERNKPDVSFFQKLKDAFTSSTARNLTGIALGGLGFWFAVAFLSYFVNCIHDQSIVGSPGMNVADHVGNDAGTGGAYLAELLINQGFGVGAVVIVVWLICMSLKLLIGYPKFRTLDFTIKSIIALITLSVVVGMLSIGLDTSVNWGGLHGRYINEQIYGLLGWSGAFILSIVLVAVFVLICLRDFVKWVVKKKREYDARREEKRKVEAALLKKEQEIQEMQQRESQDEALTGEGLAVDKPTDNAGVDDTASNVEFDPDKDTIFDMPDDLDETEEVSRTDANEILQSSDGIELEDLDDKDDSKEDNAISAVPSETVSSSVSDDKTATSVGQTVSEESVETVGEVMTVNVNHIEKSNKEEHPEYDTNLFTHAYKFPPVSYMLPGNDRIPVDAEEQLENKERIRNTLLDFKIQITSIEATVGPTVTLYEVRPDSGVKIAKIKNLADDISLSLAAIGVRIIAPIPGRGTVGIEVANKDPQTVSMRTILESKTYQEKAFGEKKFRLPVALGSTISNEVYIADLAKMPHLLVAGATGQGKSVGLNAIITSLLYSKRPEELKFVMIDPKRVEFSLYSKIEKYYLAEIPNCPQPIITNMENVVATLSSLCVEMDERYKLLESATVKQVHEYNEKFKAKKLDPREGHRYMPYIVVVIDEFADLIMTAGKEVELPIARLAQLARAVGIHVIVATQRPSTNVITGMIKANFPVRIAFKVTSGIDSKTILDHTGAQQLIGRGDMLISNNGEMTRVQCAFVDTPEVEEVCEYISRQPYPQGPYILPEPQVGGESANADIDSAPLGKKDPLMDEIARHIVSSGVASTSQIQRSFEIGFNRAGRIMDYLQKLGIVGPPMGGKPRDVLVDMATLESILASV